MIARALLVLGSALALVLTLALIAPVFVSWNGYRPLLEARLEAVFGEPVDIEGDLDITLLPRLRVTAADVVIGPETNRLATLRGAEVVLSPFAMLGPELDVQSLTLRGLDADLRLDEAGRLDLGAARRRAGIDPGNVAIQSLVLDGASFRLARGPDDAPLVLEDVDATGRAGRLIGPWDLEGVLASGGRRFGWRVNTGEAQDTQVRLKARAEPLRPATRRRDVALVDATLNWGASSATEAPVSLEGQVSLTSLAPRTAESGDLLDLPWRAEGRLRVDPNRALVQDLTIRLGPEEVAASLLGTASYDFDGAVADIVLSARQIDLDRLFGDGATGAIVPARLAASLLEAWRAREEPPTPLPAGEPRGPYARIGLGLDVEGVVAGGEVVRDVALQMRNRRDGRLAIETLRARLPGRTDVGFQGTLDLRGRRADADAPGAGAPSTDVLRTDVPKTDAPKTDAPRTDASVRGRLVARDVRPADLLAWANGTPHDPAFALPFDLDGLLTATDRAVSLEEAEIDLGDAGRLAGTVALGTGPSGTPGRWAARLQGERLTLDEVFAAPLDRMAHVLARSFELDLALDTLVLGRAEARGVTAVARYDGRTFDLDGLAVADLGGATLRAAGSLEPTASKGEVPITVEARRLDGLLALARELAPGGEFVRALEARGEALVPLVLDGAIAAARDEAGARISLRLEGDVAGTRTVFRAQRLAPPRGGVRYAGFVDLDAETSDTLARQLGLPTRPERRPGDATGLDTFDLAALDLAYEGTALTGEVEGAIDLYGARIDAAGTIARGILAMPARGAIRAERGPAAVDLLLGFDVADPARLFARLDDLGASLDGAETITGETRLRVDAQGVSLTALDLAARTGTRDIAVSGDIAARTSPRGLDLSGRLAVSDLSATGLAAALLGVPPSGSRQGPLPSTGPSEDAATVRQAFSTAPFATPPLATWPRGVLEERPVSGGIDVEVARLRLGSEGGGAPGRFRLSWPRNAIRIGDLETEVLGGRLSGRALFSRADDGPATRVVLDARLDEARLGEGEEDAPLRGTLAARVAVEGEGRSPAGLLAALTGQGSLALEGLLLRDLAPVAFARTVTQVEAQDDLIEETVAEVFRENLLGGLVEIDTVEAAFGVRDGRVVLEPLSAEADRLSLRADAAYALATGALELDLTLTPNAGTPTLDDPLVEAVIAAGPSVGFTLEPEDDGEIRIDASALTTAITVAGFEREIARLRVVEEEIIERARLSRELDRQAAERRDEETDPTAPASQPASPPASLPARSGEIDGTSTGTDAEENARENAGRGETPPVEVSPPPAPVPAPAQPPPATTVIPRSNTQAAPPAAPTPSTSDRIGRALRDALR